MATSNGARPPRAATRRAIWSWARRMLWVTEAPVRLRKYGARISRCASLQVPGKVATTRFFDCAHVQRGAKVTAAKPPARSCLRERRVLILVSSRWGSVRYRGFSGLRGWEDPDRGSRGRDREEFGPGLEQACAAAAGHADLERATVGRLGLVDDGRPERHHDFDRDRHCARAALALETQVLGPHRHHHAGAGFERVGGCAHERRAAGQPDGAAVGAEAHELAA